MSDKIKHKRSPFYPLYVSLQIIWCVVFAWQYLGILSSVEESSATDPRILILWLSASLFMALYAHVLVHEGGHWLFGKLSGYQFCSFRIGNFIWIRQAGKIKFRRISLAGTGGQCLMIPPDMKAGKIPVMLYNFGGVIANLLLSVIFLVVFLLKKSMPFLSLFSLAFMMCGFFFAITNGIPHCTRTVYNDGGNALELRNDPQAMRAFWLQLKINACVSEGVRLKDMPSAWFEFSPIEGMKNSMVATIGVFACNRLMDEGCFDEADIKMTALLKEKLPLAGIYQGLLTNDLIFCELIREKRSSRLQALMTPEQKRLMKLMKNTLSVCRTEYAYAMLATGDTEVAEKWKQKFQKIAHRYPYPGEVESENELMRLVSTCKMENNLTQEGETTV